MQTVIQVISNQSDSLRDRIVNDAALKQYHLSVAQEKKKGRNRGWAKILGNKDAQGALNIEWQPSARILLGRIVNRGGGCPALLAARYVYYLLQRYRDEIVSIQIWTQEDSSGDDLEDSGQ